MHRSILQNRGPIFFYLNRKKIFSLVQCILFFILFIFIFWFPFTNWMDWNSMKRNSNIDLFQRPFRCEMMLREEEENDDETIFLYVALTKSQLIFLTELKNCLFSKNITRDMKEKRETRFIFDTTKQSIGCIVFWALFISFFIENKKTVFQ